MGKKSKSQVQNTLAFTEAFNEFFQFANNQRDHNTRYAIRKRINLSQVKTTQYGLNSIKYKSAKDWNNIQQKVTNFNFEDVENHLNQNSYALKIYFFQPPQ